MTAAAAALCALAALPGAATADPGGTRGQGGADVPAYRTAEGATAVEGAASSTDGPRLRHGRTYTDRIEPGQRRYYTVELDATTQPRLSVTALPEPGGRVSSRDGITLTLEATDGTECARGEARIESDGAAWPLVASVARIIGPDEQCQDGGVYNLSVKRAAPEDTDAVGAAAAWPIELHLMREPGRKSGGPGEAPDDADPPTELPRMPAGRPRDIDGGTAFNDAAGMGEGVWKDRLLPGETRFYRVPVDWGQALALRAEFGTTQTTDASGYTSQGVHVEVYNPARAPVADDGALYGADDPAAVPLRTPPVTYAFRYSYDDDLAAASVAGWYYVAVHAHPDLAEFVPGTVPVTLRTELVGAPADGPDYAGDAAAAGFGVTAQDRDQAARGLTPQDAERSATLTVVGWSGIGAGTFLVAVLGLWTLLARRRAGTVPAAHPGGTAPAAYGHPRPPVPPQTSAAPQGPVPPDVSLPPPAHRPPGFGLPPQDRR